MLRLQKIDQSHRGQHAYLTEADECYFLCEYTARAGATHSPANQLVYNFKKSVKHRGTNHYHYKTSAIRQAADAFRLALGKNSVFASSTLIPIPPSKTRDHPEYDDRVVQLANQMCTGTTCQPHELIIQRESYEASHGAGHRLTPDELRELYFHVGPPPRMAVMLVDDVITAGSHFRASSDYIKSYWPDRRVIGLFLARRLAPDPFADFEAL